MSFQETIVENTNSAPVVTETPPKPEKKWVNIADRKNIDFGVLASIPSVSDQEKKRKEAQLFFGDEFDNFVATNPDWMETLQLPLRD